MSKLRIFLIVMILGGLRIAFSPISGYFLVAWFCIGIVYLGILSMMPRFQFFLPSIQKTTEGNVLLSFDDGPDAERTGRVLDILKRQKAQAIFFLIGHKIEGNEALVRRIVAEGHLVGSHSLSHSPAMGFATQKGTDQEIMEGHRKLMEVVPTAGFWFRSPFGMTNPSVAKTVQKGHLRHVAWSVRSFDTVKKDPQKLLKTLMSQIKGTDVVLLHDTQAVTLAMLEDLILELKKKNLTLKAELAV